MKRVLNTPAGEKRRRIYIYIGYEERFALPRKWPRTALTTNH